MSDQPVTCVRCGGPFGDQETPGRTGQGEPCHARTLTCVEVLRAERDRLREAVGEINDALPPLQRWGRLMPDVVRELAALGGLWRWLAEEGAGLGLVLLDGQWTADVQHRDEDELDVIGPPAATPEGALAGVWAGMEGGER